MIEFALVILIFLVFVVALFDFVRYLVVQSILRSAASRAVSHASVVDWLDANCMTLPVGPPGTPRADCVAARIGALERVLGTLEQLPTNTLVARQWNNGMHWLVNGSATAPAAELILSAKNDYRAYYQNGLQTSNPSRSANLASLDSPAGAAARPALGRVMQDEPIQVHIRAMFRPALGLIGYIPVEGIAAGYRERRFNVSFPLPVNCQGVVVPVGEAPDNSVCPCPVNPGNPLIVAINGVCQCQNPAQMTMDADGKSCHCINAAQVIGANNTCVCPTGCPPNTVQNPTTCACNCPGNQTPTGNGTCGCVGPHILNGVNCTCPPNPTCTNSGGTLEDNGCTCQCKPPKELTANGSCQCQPFPCNPPGVRDNNDCSCRCPTNFTLNNGNCTCQSPYVLNGGNCQCPSVSCINGSVNQATCQCECPWPKVLSHGQCVCPPFACNTPGIRDNDACVCRCPTNEVLTAAGDCVCNAPHQTSNGQCVCPTVQCTNGTVHQDDCQCHCPEGQVNNNGVCGCPTGLQCSGGHITNNCQCQCDGGQVPVNGVCTCPGGQDFNGTYCFCPGGQVWDGSHCVCPQNQIFSNGHCTCPDGWVLQADGSCFNPEV